ncbi:hypothetical protein CIK05_03130 [Bdellovibrio sp. qaytius]|nr:hypothetical protein CIK05_03130 [Bdellovibrio sp. qaytius]
MNNQNPTQQVARRFVTQELAHIEIYGKGGKILTRMGNLSASGAFFEVLSPNFSVKKGDIARVTINLRSLNRVHVVDCEVVWSKGLGVGVQFLKREELQDKLTNMLFSNQSN